MKQVGLEPKPGLTAAGAAHHQHVFVPGVFGVRWAVGHHQPFCFGQDDVIGKLGCHERLNILGGARLAVVPSWQQYDTDRVKLILDPGLAFGTGGHETTSLCLEALDEQVRGGERVLDIGTGSGILAIAALKLGAGSAEGVDIDPMCVRTAGENAARNGVADRFKVLVGDLSDKASGQYNIITANIVAAAILSLAPHVPVLMAPDARFIASGIIDERKDEVLAGLRAAGLAPVEVKEKRGWVCIICKKSETKEA